MLSYTCSVFTFGANDVSTGPIAVLYGAAISGQLNVGVEVAPTAVKVCAGPKD